MTPELFSRYQLGRPPFDGSSVLVIGAPDARTVLEAIHAALDALVLDETEIFLNEDWHEHDGFLTDSKRCAWSLLRPKLQTIDSWRAVCPIDYNVRLAIYPDSYEWLLRCSIDVDSLNGIDEVCPYLDFTAQRGSQAEHVLDLMRQSLLDGYVQRSAADHFQSCYAG